MIQPQSFSFAIYEVVSFHKFVIYFIDNGCRRLRTNKFSSEKLPHYYFLPQTDTLLIGRVAFIENLENSQIEKCCEIGNILCKSFDFPSGTMAGLYWVQKIQNYHKLMAAF